MPARRKRPPSDSPAPQHPDPARQEEQLTAALPAGQAALAREISAQFRSLNSGSSSGPDALRQLLAGLQRQISAVRAAFRALAESGALEIACKRAYPRVVLCGLQKRQDLNGQEGFRLARAVEEEAGSSGVRYSVHLDSEVYVAVREENMNILEDAVVLPDAEPSSGDEKATALWLASETGILGGTKANGLKNMFDLFAGVITAMQAEPSIARVWDLPAFADELNALSVAAVELHKCGRVIARERLIDARGEADAIFSQAVPAFQSALGAAVVVARTVASIPGALAQWVVAPEPSGRAAWSNDTATIERIARLAGELLVRNYMWTFPKASAGIRRDQVKDKALCHLNTVHMVLVSSIMNWAVAKSGLERFFLDAFVAAGLDIADAVITCWRGLAGHGGRQLTSSEATSVNIASHLARYDSNFLPALIRAGDREVPDSGESQLTLAELCEVSLRHACATSPDDFFFAVVISAVCDMVEGHLCEFILVADGVPSRNLIDSSECVRFANAVRASQFAGLIVREVIRGTIPPSEDGPIHSAFSALGALTVRADLDKHTDYKSAAADIRRKCDVVSRAASDCHRIMWKTGGGHAVLAFLSRLDLRHARELRLFDKLAVNATLFLNNLVDDRRGATKYLPVSMYDLDGVAALRKIASVTTHWPIKHDDDLSSMLATAINQLCSAMTIDTKTSELLYVCKGCSRRSTPTESFKICSGCRVERYCSLECQRTHWPQHKADCLHTRQQVLSGRVDPRRAQMTRDIERQLHHSFWTIAENRVAAVCYLDKIKPARIVVEVDLRRGAGTENDPASFHVYDESAFADGRVPPGFLEKTFNPPERGTVVEDILDRIHRRKTESAADQVITVAVFKDCDCTVYRSIVGLAGRIQFAAVAARAIQGFEGMDRDEKIDAVEAMLNKLVSHMIPR